jgi:hypothetical protein
LTTSIYILNILYDKKELYDIIKFVNINVFDSANKIFILELKDGKKNRYNLIKINEILKTPDRSEKKYKDCPVESEIININTFPYDNFDLISEYI